jgi:predicted nucleic acid-binding protein
MSDNSCFVDANIWLYAFIVVQDAEKAKRSRALIENETIVISTQVINEVCVNLIKKANFTETNVRALIDSFYANHRVVEMSRSTLIEASRLRERFSLSFWDSTIVASAFEQGTSILYTEDIQDGLVIENRLKIVNPYSRDV